MIWRNASAARSLIVVFMLVGEGDRIATAQNSAMAIAAELMLCVIFVFIRLLAICWFYLFLGTFCTAWQKSLKIPWGRVRITRDVQGAERADRLSEKLGRIKQRLSTGYGAWLR